MKGGVPANTEGKPHRVTAWPTRPWWEPHQVNGRAQVKMRKTQREKQNRQVKPMKSRVKNEQGLHPVAKQWLDEVIIPILLRKLKQEWNAEKAA